MNHSACVAISLLASALFWTSPALAASKNVDARGCAEIRSVEEGDKTANVRRALCTLTKTGFLEEMSSSSFADQRRAVDDFYRPTGYALAWFNDDKHPTEQALKLIAALQNSDQQGLRSEDYDGPRWATRLNILENKQSRSGTNLAHLDLAVTVSAMRYISDLYRGRLSPAQFHFNWPRKECNTAAILRDQLVKATDVTAVLEQLQPPYDGYRRTLKALNDYIVMAKQGQGELPMPVKPVWSGDHYSGVEELARRLKRFGDMPEDIKIPAGSDLYEDNLKNAIRHFQRRHGLNPDGSLEPKTYKQLTVAIEYRIAQLQIALELWRWLPADLTNPWILVNVPEFRLRAFSDDRPPLSMAIVAGDADNHETPMFVDSIDYLIFRPEWHVPLKIQQTDIVPEIERHPTYLASKRFQIVDKRGVAHSTVLDSTILRKLHTGELELHQEPGPTNELGLVKFVLPHQNGVYMHGSLDRDLFERFRRDYSHGCIRVEDPAILSAWALHGDSRWNANTIERAMNGKVTINLNLPRHVTVVTFYGTAMVDDNGEVHFSEDIYGYDAMVERALAKSGSTLHRDDGVDLKPSASRGFLGELRSQK
jgi:murein L,D-transpeptidase YcbB/YkuD